MIHGDNSDQVFKQTPRGPDGVAARRLFVNELISERGSGYLEAGGSIR